MTSTGFILISEPQRGAVLRQNILDHWRFTDVFSAKDWDMHSAEMCLLSFDGANIEYACLGLRGRHVATAKFIVTFSDFIQFGRLEISKIQARVSTPVREYFTRAASGSGGRLPASTWLETIKAIQDLCPESAEALNELIRRKRKSLEHLPDSVQLQMAAEKDTLGVALDIFDSTNNLRQKTLGAWEEPDDYAPPFMTGLKSIQLFESQMLINDMNIFPGSHPIRTEFGTRFILGDRKLDVIYANQTDIEGPLGADLIYYNSRFDCYCVVQYKRMYPEILNGKSVFTYRPSRDGSFLKEIESMRAFCAQSRFIPFSGPHCNFRLSGHGFFFKFCPLRFEPVANSLIKGMYLPWDLLESALSQNAMVGPKGGSLISFDNTPRYFNNTQFTELVRDGWIGTQGSATNQITAIIQASLERGRAVTLAVERKLKPGEADDLAYWEHCAQFSVSPFKPT